MLYPVLVPAPVSGTVPVPRQHWKNVKEKNKNWLEVFGTL
jgi:hypothetical protein